MCERYDTKICFMDHGDSSVGIFGQDASFCVNTYNLEPEERQEFISNLKEAICQVLNDWEWISPSAFVESESDEH